MTDRVDLMGVIGAVRDGQQQVALAALRLVHGDRKTIAMHLVNAQRRLTAAEIELQSLAGSRHGQDS